MCSNGHFLKDYKNIEIERNFREILERFHTQYETIEMVAYTPKMKKNNKK
jgi:hypothetical protein